MQDVGTDCDLPLACGTLGICTPHVQSICACPNQSYFEPIDNNYLSLGCKPLTPLPSNCTAIDQSTPISFVELKSTATIFQLNGWTFPNRIRTVDGCKMACSLDCSCYGFSYQVSTSSCFLIFTQNISLLTVFNFTATTLWLLMIGFAEEEIFADDYVAHLKVVSLPPQSSSNNVEHSVPLPFNKQVPMMALIGIIFASCLVVSFLLGLAGYHMRKRRRELRQQQAKEDPIAYAALMDFGF